MAFETAGFGGGGGGGDAWLPRPCKRLRRVVELDPELEGTPSASSAGAVPPRPKRSAPVLAPGSDSEASQPSPGTPDLEASQPFSGTPDSEASQPSPGTPPSPPSAAALAATAAMRASEGAPMQVGGRLDSLVAMGFLPGPARSALQAANGNLNMALEICLGNRGSPAAVAAPPRLVPFVPVGQRGANRQTEVPLSARAKRAAQRKTQQQSPALGSSDASDLELCKSDSSPSIELSDSEMRRFARGSAQQTRIIRRDQKSDSEDGSDVSVSSRKRKRKGGATRALREVSAAAQARMLEALAGPAVEGESEKVLKRNRNKVRRAIVRGHTNLRADFFPSSEDIVSKCEKFSELKAHQRVGVRWMLALHNCVPGMILADEMGLGKTAQALCFLEILASKKPSLIVAPASLLRTWEIEAARWTPRVCTLKAHAPTYAGRLDAQDAFLRDPEAFQIIITTPNAFNSKENRHHFFRRVNFEYLIVDEAHGLKNAGTNRYRDISRTVKCERRLLLTGTPVQNCLAELATLLGFALSDGRRNQVSEELRVISEEPLAKALQQMQAAAAPLILRRLKTDVLSELPEKRGVVVYYEMTDPQRAIYKQEIIDARKEHPKQSASTVREAFFRLRRVCLHPLMCKTRLSKEQIARLVTELREKRPDFGKVSFKRCEQEVTGWSDFDKHSQALEHGLSKEFLATEDELLNSGKVIELLRILRKQADSGDKTLVFSQFTQLLDVIEVVMRVSNIPFLRLDGKTAIEDRAGLVAGFQDEGGPQVFLLSTKAGGLGLNLTAANAVVMLDLDFNPQNSRQAEDRVHRLGQTKEVTIYYLVTRGTVEEMVLSRNLEKMKLDQHFGAKRAALEVAANAVEVAAPQGEDDDHDEGEEDGQAEEEEAGELGGAMAKQCEKDVMKQLREQLQAMS